MTINAIITEFSILIVEDNHVNMTLNKIILKTMFPKCTIEEAYNGREAVEMTLERKFDIILMDIMMPEMDGYEATATIRKQELNGNTPIIALTASILPEELQNCLKVGFSDTLNKPINRDEMNYVILKWLIKE